MNQSILFNDDLKYDKQKACWLFTGLLSGELITIEIAGQNQQIDNDLKFNLEALVEDWLEDNEPEENTITL